MKAAEAEAAEAELTVAAPADATSGESAVAAPATDDTSTDDTSTGDARAAADPAAAAPSAPEETAAATVVADADADAPATAAADAGVVEAPDATPLVHADAATAAQAEDAQTVEAPGEAAGAAPDSGDASAGVAQAAVAPAAADPVEPVLEAEAVPAEPPVVVVDPETEAETPSSGEESAAAEPGTEAIRIRGLVKQFGDNRAVDGVDLTVPAASFYGIVGPNGAGKTTTLSIVAGLLRADEGSVLICGIDQAADPLAAKRVMGVLPDRLRTFDRLTGRQLLYYYGLLRGLAADVIEKRAADLARAFDLGDALNRVVSDYSAGMTKKIMLAGAMIHSPRVLVLDEPFESVDPVSSAVILDILRAYVSHGGTVILSSHGMDLVERVCSRVAIIVNGEVLAEGTIDEVRAGQTLESRFVELAGSSSEVEGLEWLHTFSD